MPIDIIDIASQGSGAVNEDRTGSAGTLAWVIDGATDLVETPLVGEHSDAAWRNCGAMSTQMWPAQMRSIESLFMFVPRRW